jgi:hypothetical protein
MRKSNRRRDSIAKMLNFYQKAAERAAGALDSGRVGAAVRGAKLIVAPARRTYH